MATLSDIMDLIDGIVDAKADLKTSIVGKGVAVPSSAKLADLSDLVDEIQTGVTPTGTKSITITANGTTTEDVSAYANAQITANVPNTYAAADEGKVVNNGALVAQGSDTVTQNGTVDTTLINSLLVNVAASGGLDYVKSTVTMIRNSAAQIDREFEDFILIAYLTTPPTAVPSNNYTSAMIFAYADDDFWQPSKATTVKSNGSVFASNVISPSQLLVGETTIAISAFSNSNNVAGEWTVVQIELPSDFGVYSWRNVAADIAGGGA